MKKKLLAILTMTALMSLASCTNSGTPGGEGGGGGDPVGPGGDDTITIKYTNSWGKDYQSTLDALLEDFMKANPKIKVEEIKAGGYDGIHTQTKSDLNTGTGDWGDLVICYPDHVVDYIDYGMAVNLETLMDDPEIGWTAEEKEDMIAGFMAEGSQFPVEGTYCLPYVKSTEALFYNEDVIIGLDLSKIDATINGGSPLNKDYIDNLTWEEFFNKLCPAIAAYNDSLDAAHKILIDGGETAINGICGYDSTANLFINLCEQYGVGYSSVDQDTGKGSIDFNNDNTKELMKLFNKAALEGYLQPSTRLNNNSYCSSYFVAQNLLFNIGSTAGASHEVSSNFEVGVAPIPGATGGNKHVISQGPSLCILSHPEGGKELRTKRIQAAWELYKFMTSTERAAEWAITVNYLPVRTSSLSTDDYLDHASTAGKTPRSSDLLSAKTCQYSTDASNNVFTSAVFKGSSVARTQVGALMSDILLADHELSDAELKTLFDTVYGNIIKEM